MLYGPIHPAIFNYLQAAGILVQPYCESNLSGENAIFISAFNSTLHDCFFGIQTVLQLRLSGDPNPIVFLSFLSKEKIALHDLYNVLGLPCSYFIQLPATKSDLLSAINLQKNISIKELDNFRYETCKIILAEKIRKLNHKAGFGDQIFRPLLYACYGDKSNPKTFANVKKAIKQIQQELSSENISEFIQTASCFPPVEINPADAELKNILRFTNTIKEYTAYLNELFVQEQDQLDLDKIANSITQKYYPKYDLIKEL